jgi:DnaJ-domain-containing protein 1
MNVVGLSPHAFGMWASKQHSISPFGGAGTTGVDYYDILGVHETADQDEIRRAYRKQALLWHPDKKSADCKEEATERFKAINAAYDTLSDEARRSEYNAKRAAAANSGSARPEKNVSLGKAWEIFMSFIISATMKQFEQSGGGSGDLVRLLSSVGVAVVLPAAARGSGGVALVAITVALLNHQGAISIYRDLNEDEKVAFS